jgi:hypothetical protein
MSNDELRIKCHSKNNRQSIKQSLLTFLQIVITCIYFYVPEITLSITLFDIDFHVRNFGIIFRLIIRCDFQNETLLMIGDGFLRHCCHEITDSRIVVNKHQ